jgi:peptidoglycan/LPS O-acetylase OafA/YrhL
MNKFSSSGTPLHLKYRSDIDGLRGIAILAVVIFHAFPEWVTGGYTGVSIFFVISGYLISSIIYKSLDDGSFSFIDFYSRRIRRIFPALIVVMLSAFTIGWFYLLAGEFKQLGLYIAGGAAFIDNFIAWQGVDYFDSSAELKPLLHLWSLGIEEQFYIFWPLLVWVCWKRKSSAFIVLAIAFIGSFALNIKGFDYDPVATFYAPWTRFWEIIFGGLLAYWHIYHPNAFNRPHSSFQIKWLPSFISFLGFSILVYSIFFYTKKTAYPGWNALAPVVGALLVINGREGNFFNKRILSNKAIVWFGAISYSLYLWHWVILSFARLIGGEEPRIRYKLALLLLSVALSWLTYRFIENPIRFGSYAKSKTIFLVIALSVLGFIGLNTYERGGLPFRSYNKTVMQYPESMVRTPRQEECFGILYAHSKKENWYCEAGVNSNSVDYFAFGDSHALSLIPALEVFGQAKNKRILFAGTAGCPPLLGIQSLRGPKDLEEHNCKLLNERIYDYVRNNGIRNVILIGRWTYYTKSQSRPSEINLIAKHPNGKVDAVSSEADLNYALKNTVSLYQKIGVNVFIVKDNPQQSIEPLEALKKASKTPYDWAINKFSVLQNEHLTNQSKVNAYIDNSGATIVSFNDILCTNGICPFVEGGKFLYFDDDHLSIFGAKKVAPELSRVLLGQ